jgi:MFS transporter, FSR family, fosmidomycin resistance protein
MQRSPVLAFTLVVLGLAHGVSDGAAGLLLGSLSHSMPLWQVGLLVLVYNALAFGGQPVAGFVADQLRQPKLAALAGLLVMALAVVIAPGQPAVAVGIAGIGSALFHVGGGALALCATPERAAGPGVFAAPGVVGLAIGGALAAASPGALPVWPCAVLLVGLAVAVTLADAPPLPYAERGDEPLLEGHEAVMLVLLTAIALRSVVWNGVELLHDGQTLPLLLLAFAAGGGKVLGGILADRFGWRRWAMGALLVAAPLLTFGGHQMIFLLPGVALLQSATPVMLALMGRALPRQPAVAAGMALGLGIAAGGLPLLGGFAAWTSTPLALLVAACASAALLWSVTRWRGTMVAAKRATQELIGP